MNIQREKMVQSDTEQAASGLRSPSYQKTSHSYYVVMEDFGKRGLEATVTPETTRRGIVALIAGGNLRDIAFIHHVDGLYVEDVTEEIMTEVAATLVPIFPDAGDEQAARFDHARDYRKHSTAAE